MTDQNLIDEELRLDRLRKTLRFCCGELPFQNMCNCRGKLDFEVACGVCKSRTGALPSRWMAAKAWNDGLTPDPSASNWGYEVQSQSWGYEYVNSRKLKEGIKP